MSWSIPLATISKTQILPVLFLFPRTSNTLLREVCRNLRHKHFSNYIFCPHHLFLTLLCSSLCFSMHPINLITGILSNPKSLKSTIQAHPFENLLLINPPLTSSIPLSCLFCLVLDIKPNGQEDSSGLLLTWCKTFWNNEIRHDVKKAHRERFPTLSHNPRIQWCWMVGDSG